MGPEETRKLACSYSSNPSMEWLGPYLSSVPLLSESHSIEESDEEDTSRSKGKIEQG